MLGLKVLLVAAMGWGVLGVFWFVCLAIYAVVVFLRWAARQLVQ